MFNKKCKKIPNILKIEKQIQNDLFTQHEKTQQQASFKKVKNQQQQIIQIQQIRKNKHFQDEDVFNECLEAKTKKKIIVEAPKQKKLLIASNSQKIKEQNQQQKHYKNEDTIYESRNNDWVQKMQLEEQLAKQKYLQKVKATHEIKSQKQDPTVYRGINNYADHKLSPGQIANASQLYRKRMGPSRVNSSIRNTCRFDYVQSLCKDWHDSGYCPFGNSCLYLHDRSTDRTGLQLEQDFEKTEKERWFKINNPQIARRTQRDIFLKNIAHLKPPEKCLSCQQLLKNPVEIQCLHVYCMHCALKITKCVQCSQQCTGIMNCIADKIKKMSHSYNQLLNEEQKQDSKAKKQSHSESLTLFQR